MFLFRALAAQLAEEVLLYRFCVCVCFFFPPGAISCWWLGEKRLGKFTRSCLVRCTVQSTEGKKVGVILKKKKKKKESGAVS